MNYLKVLSKSIIYIISLILIITIFVTILSYFNIFSDNIIKFFKLITPIISIFTGAFIMGKSSNKNGYLEGIKIAIIIDLIFIIFSIIFKDFKIESIIFYIILLASSILGSIIGIQKKVKTN